MMNQKIRDLKFYEYGHEWISEKNPIAVYKIIRFFGLYEKPYQIHILPYGIDGDQVVNCYTKEVSSLEEAKEVINKGFKKQLADYLEKIKEIENNYATQKLWRGILRKIISGK